MNRVVLAAQPQLSSPSSGQLRSPATNRSRSRSPSSPCLDGAAAEPGKGAILGEARLRQLAGGRSCSAKRCWTTAHNLVVKPRNRLALDEVVECTSREHRASWAHAEGAKEMNPPSCCVAPRGG